MTPTVVHHRVDALTLAYRVDLSAHTLVDLKVRGTLARQHGRASFHDSALQWELTVPMRGDGSIWRLRRENHARVQIDLRAPGGTFEVVEESRATASRDVRMTDKGFVNEAKLGGDSDVKVRTEPGWTVELVWYAQHLADNPMRDVLDEGRELVGRWGDVREVRVRRIDLAADVAGFEIGEDDWKHLVRRSRVKVFPFTTKPSARGKVTDDGFRGTKDLEVREAELPALADTYARARISGIRVGSSDVVARIYDKRQELADKNDTDKAAAEAGRWRSGGWDGNAPVARVEFQLRGEALRELGARDPDRCEERELGEIVDLPHYVPRIWRTCLKWLRLARRDDQRRQRTRRTVDARWRALYAASFGARDANDLEPIRRRRVRGGATAAQALGALVSCVGAAGKLDDVRELPEADHDYKEQPSEKLRAMLAILTSWGADVLAAALVERWGSPQDACVHVAIVVNAARGRFSGSRSPPTATATAPPTEEEDHHGKQDPHGRLEGPRHHRLAAVR